MEPSLLLTIFALLSTQLCNAFGEDCPTVFKRYSQDHSYCKPKNTSCEILAYYPNEEDQSKIMNLHNSYRAGIATGTTVFPGVLPPAGDMLEMEWDNELAAVAQKYAEQCIYKHDCANCRRVLNFGVGQNIAIQKWIGGSTVPQPDWNFAVTEWFSEIIYFPMSNICPFQPPNGGGKEYRHFSQLVWSKTFRVGCGYVLYKEGTDTYVRLYICNYGPAGNIYDTCVFNVGPPCSNCPQNSCCGASCLSGSNYFGLCKRTDNEAPRYLPPQGTLFYCSFHGDPDCDHYIEGIPKWVIQSTLSGNYLGTTLNGGENSTVVFKKLMKPSDFFDQFCITIEYRKGPSVDGDESSGNAIEIFFCPEQGMTYTQELATYGSSDYHLFAKFTMTLSWKMNTQFKLNFNVPPGKPPQFFHVQSIIATNGPCPTS